MRCFLVFLKVSFIHALTRKKYIINYEKLRLNSLNLISNISKDKAVSFKFSINIENLMVQKNKRHLNEPSLKKLEYSDRFCPFQKQILIQQRDYI